MKDEDSDFDSAASLAASALFSQSNSAPASSSDDYDPSSTNNNNDNNNNNQNIQANAASPHSIPIPSALSSPLENNTSNPPSLQHQPPSTQQQHQDEHESNQQHNNQQQQSDTSAPSNVSITVLDGHDHNQTPTQNHTQTTPAAQSTQDNNQKAATTNPSSSPPPLQPSAASSNPQQQQPTAQANGDINTNNNNSNSNPVGNILEEINKATIELDANAVETLKIFQETKKMRDDFKTKYENADAYTKKAKTKEEKEAAANMRSNVNILRDEISVVQRRLTESIALVVQGAIKVSKLTAAAKLPTPPQFKMEVQQVHSIARAPIRDLPLLQTRSERAVSDAKKRETQFSDRNFICYFRAFSYCDRDDLVMCSLVNKAWNVEIRKNEAWRLYVLGLDMTLRGHSAPVTSLAKIGNYIFSGSLDGKVKVWDIFSLECKRTVNMNEYAYYPRPPDTSHMSSSSHLNSSLGTPVFKPVAVTTLAVYDQVLFIGLSSGKVNCRSIFGDRQPAPQRPESEILIGHRGPVKSIVFSRSRNLIFTASADNRIGCWNLLSKVNEKYLEKHSDQVSCLAVTSQYLFSGSWDSHIHVWNLSTLEFHLTLGSKDLDFPRKHNDRITSMVVHKNRLITAAWDCFIKVWDTENLTFIQQVFVNPVGICWSLSIREAFGRPYLVAGVRENDIDIIDITSLRTYSSMSIDRWAYRPNCHGDRINALLCVEDGRIISGSHDWTLKVWNYSGSSRQRFAAGKPPLGVQIMASPQSMNPSAPTPTHASSSLKSPPPLPAIPSISGSTLNKSGTFDSGTPTVAASPMPVPDRLVRRSSIGNAPSGTPFNAPAGTPFNAPSGTPMNAPSGTPMNAPSGTPMNAPSGTPMNGHAYQPSPHPAEDATANPSSSSSTSKDADEVTQNNNESDNNENSDSNNNGNNGNSSNSADDLDGNANGINDESSKNQDGNNNSENGDDNNNNNNMDDEIDETSDSKRLKT